MSPLEEQLRQKISLQLPEAMTRENLRKKMLNLLITSEALFGLVQSFIKPFQKISRDY